MFPDAINAMDAMNATDATVAQKIWNLLTSAERRSAVVLLALMVIGMAQTLWTLWTQ
jgi:hypothetical protein